MFARATFPFEIPGSFFRQCLLPVTEKRQNNMAYSMGADLMESMPFLQRKKDTGGEAGRRGKALVCKVEG